MAPRKVDPDIVNGHDVRTMSKDDLIALKEAVLEEHGTAKHQWRDACAAYHENGVRSSRDQLGRLEGRMRVAAAKLLRIDRALADLRRRSSERNAERAEAMRRARQVNDTHLAFLHAFKRATREIVLQAHDGHDLHGDIVQRARELAGDIYCKDCEALGVQVTRTREEVSS